MNISQCRDMILAELRPTVYETLSIQLHETGYPHSHALRNALIGTAGIAGLAMGTKGGRGLLKKASKSLGKGAAEAKAAGKEATGMQSFMKGAGDVLHSARRAGAKASQSIGRLGKQIYTPTKTWDKNVIEGGKVTDKTSGTITSNKIKGSKIQSKPVAPVAPKPTGGTPVVKPIAANKPFDEFGKKSVDLMAKKKRMERFKKTKMTPLNKTQPVAGANPGELYGQQGYGMAERFNRSTEQQQPFRFFDTRTGKPIKQESVTWVRI